MLSTLKTLLTIVCFSISLLPSFAQDPYQLYNSKGKSVKYTQLIKELKGADIILFGEFHNNPISHWLQLKLTKELYTAKTSNLMLGAEMFEADQQTYLTKYILGEINEKSFNDSMRLWSNYSTDYKPLVEFAKEHAIPFFATNVPRIFAKSVFKGGFEALDTLTEQQKQYIAPLPIVYDSTLSSYQAMLSMGAHGGRTAQNFPKAQAIKDATMAHFILHNYRKDAVFIHFNGAYHSDRFEGIYWYLKQLQPTLKIITISTVSQPTVNTLENQHKERANFIICVDEDMTTTY